jgi:hypothetical protein
MTTPDLSLPLNDFERMLMAVQDGSAQADTMLDALPATTLVILVDRAPGPDDLFEGIAVPLVLGNPQGRPLLAVFTAPERSIPMTLQFPQFGFALPVLFRELLKVMRPGIGLVLNPGTAFGFEMPAASVERMRQEALLN